MRHNFLFFVFMLFCINVVGWKLPFCIAISNDFESSLHTCACCALTRLLRIYFSMESKEFYCKLGASSISSCMSRDNECC